MVGGWFVTAVADQIIKVYGLRVGLRCLGWKLVDVRWWTVLLTSVGMELLESDQTVLLMSGFALEGDEVTLYICRLFVSLGSAEVGEVEEICLFVSFGVISGNGQDGLLRCLLLRLRQLLSFLPLERIDGFVGLYVLAFDIFIVDKFDDFVEGSVNIGLPNLEEGYSVRFRPVSWCYQKSLRTVFPTCMFCSHSRFQLSSLVDFTLVTEGPSAR